VAVKGGREEARFSRQAQLAIGPLLLDTEPVEVQLFGRRYQLTTR
jgi:hypothetical protein